MTKLAYMVREDWGQHGTAMVPQSAGIREWIGETPYLFAVTDVKKFNHVDRGADVEAAEYIAPSKADRIVFNIKGNDHRLVVAVDFGKQIVWVKWLGTHGDYDKIDVRTVEHNG